MNLAQPMALCHVSIFIWCLYFFYDLVFYNNIFFSLIRESISLQERKYVNQLIKPLIQNHLRRCMDRFDFVMSEKLVTCYSAMEKLMVASACGTLILLIRIIATKFNM